MKRILLIFSMIVFLAYCKNSSPTEPNVPPPKPMAKYTGVLLVSQVYYPFLNSIMILTNYAVTNTNGIGAEISKVELELWYQNQAVWEQTYVPTTTQRIEADSIYEWEGTETLIYPGYLYAAAKVIIHVQDDNGYNQTITGAPVKFD